MARSKDLKSPKGKGKGSKGSKSIKPAKPAKSPKGKSKGKSTSTSPSTSPTASILAERFNVCYRTILRAAASAGIDMGGQHVGAAHAFTAKEIALVEANLNRSKAIKA